MKKKIFSLLLCFITALVCPLSLSACESVAPGAWVTLKTDGGYVYYTSYMYNTSHGHIVYYASEEDSEKAADKTNFGSFDIITITFSPRILGPEVRGETKTTIVDVKSWYEMDVSVNKSHESYSANKKMYLNGMELEPYDTFDSEYLTIWHYKDFGLIRGNPNGRINDVINVLEYK